MKRIVTLLATLTVSACAGGLSKDECLYADWRAIGYEDGSRGYSPGAVTSHRRACAKKAGVTPDMETYLVGREAGLRTYCRPANGFAVGSRGGTYYGVCTGPEEDIFAIAFQRGSELHALHVDVNGTAAALASAGDEIEQITIDIAAAEAALISPATPHLARIDILADIKTLVERRARLQDSLDPLAVEHERARIALADYRAFLASEGPYPGAPRMSAAAY